MGDRNLAPINRHDRGPLELVPRNLRRKALENESRIRKTGKWPAWVRHQLLPGQVGSTGWLPEIYAAHVNQVFTVLERDAGSGITHLMISSLSGIRPTWLEAQRIKNDIAGTSATAVEVYPPQGEVVDDADAYHLWVLPAPFPATIFEGQRNV